MRRWGDRWRRTIWTCTREKGEGPASEGGLYNGQEMVMREANS